MSSEQSEYVAPVSTKQFTSKEPTLAATYMLEDLVLVGKLLHNMLSSAKPLDFSVTDEGSALVENFGPHS